MLFDLNSAYKHFDRDVQFAEQTEDDKILNDAYEFSQKNSPTSVAITGIIQKVVEKLESGKGTFGDTLFRIKSPNSLTYFLSNFLWDKYQIDARRASSRQGRFRMPKEEVLKKIKYVENWWNQVNEKCISAIEKRKKEIAQNKG